MTRGNASRKEMDQEGLEARKGLARMPCRKRGVTGQATRPVAGKGELQLGMKTS